MHWTDQRLHSLRAERGRAVDRRPLPYPRPITLFRVPAQPSNEIYATEPLLGWGELAVGGLEVIEVEGFHGQPMFREPYVRELALRLRERMRAAQDSTGANSITAARVCRTPTALCQSAPEFPILSAIQRARVAEWQTRRT
jgi:hypothetical protein